MDRDERIVTERAVSFLAGGHRHAGVSEDLGRHGAFVRSGHLLPRGERVVLEFDLPSGAVSVGARVAHVLPPETARSLGRAAGMGLAFEGALPPTLLDFLEKQARRAQAPAQSGADVLVVAASLLKMERLRRAFLAAGHRVRSSSELQDAFEQCHDAPPAALVADADLAASDGWAFVRGMTSRPRLESVPILVVGELGSHVGRLEAYRRGVRDVVEEPFTDEEACLRLARVLDAASSSASGLRGALGDLAPTTLLGLLDFERKSGLLRILREDAAATLHLAEGRVVKVDGGRGGAPRERVMSILSWTSGSFSFEPRVVGASDEIGLPTQHLLMEHARLTDEAAREDDPPAPN